MVQYYGSPYIITAFVPHFVLCSAMPLDENKRARITQQLESTLKPILAKDWEMAEIALAVRAVEGERWKIVQSFRLRG